jgi:hypothetical protein
LYIVYRRAVQDPGVLKMNPVYGKMRVKSEDALSRNAKTVSGKLYLERLVSYIYGQFPLVLRTYNALCNETDRRARLDASL